MGTPKIGASVILYQPGGKFLFSKRLKPICEGLYSVPGGKVEFGESLKDAAVRELQEETALVINPAYVYSAGILENISFEDDSHWITHIFFAKQPKDQEPVHVEPSKNDAWEWLTIEEVKEKGLWTGFSPILELVKNRTSWEVAE